MIPLIKTLAAPLLSLVFMMVASGLFNTFVSLRLEMEGFSAEEIGCVTSALYVGILLGSLWIDRWISKVGHVRSLMAFSGILAALTLAQGLWINPWYWSGLRMMGGIATAGVFVVIESWFLIQSGIEKRGAALSLYLAVFYAALSGGQLLIDASEPKSWAPFCITAAFLACSILPVSLYKSAPPKMGEPVSLTIGQLFRISPLGFIGGIISGMLLAAVYGLVPLYAKDIGCTMSEIGLFMAVLIFGGFSLQWPIGYLADKKGRLLLLNIASFVTALLAIVLALFHDASLWVLLPLVFAFGGFSFTLYPLSMAYACEKVKESEIVAVTGGFVLSYSMGAVAGPLLAPLFMLWLGNGGLFYFLALITLSLGLLGLRKPALAQVRDSEKR